MLTYIYHSYYTLKTTTIHVYISVKIRNTPGSCMGRRFVDSEQFSGGNERTTGECAWYYWLLRCRWQHHEGRGWAGKQGRFSGILEGRWPAHSPKKVSTPWLWGGFSMFEFPGCKGVIFWWSTKFLRNHGCGYSRDRKRWGSIEPEGTLEEIRAATEFVLCEVRVPKMKRLSLDKSWRHDKKDGFLKHPKLFLHKVNFPFQISPPGDFCLEKTFWKKSFWIWIIPNSNSSHQQDQQEMVTALNDHKAK